MGKKKPTRHEKSLLLSARGSIARLNLWEDSLTPEKIWHYGYISGLVNSHCFEVQRGIRSLALIDFGFTPGSAMLQWTLVTIKKQSCYYRTYLKKRRWKDSKRPFHEVWIVVFHKPHDASRAGQLSRLMQKSTKSPQDHRVIGELLSFSQEAVNDFIVKLKTGDK